MVVGATSATRWDFEDLAAWLISRGVKVGPEQTVVDLKRYVEAPLIPVARMLALDGLRVHGRGDLGQGIALISWNDVPETPATRIVEARFRDSFDGKHPSAALVQEMGRAKRHLSPGEEWTPWDEEKIRDALLCVGIVVPCSPIPLVSWLQFPEWAPTRGVGFTIGLPHLEGRRRNDGWSTEHGPVAADVFARFRALPSAQREALRVPLQRLASAMRAWSTVDSAIDLGIALEALLLADTDTSELTFKLRLRVSRYLEPAGAGRERFFDAVRDLYAIRSTAVHRGHLPDTFKARPTTEILEDGYRVVARALRRMIADGIPDWKAVELG